MVGMFVAAQLTAGLLFDYVWPQVRFSILVRQFVRAEEHGENPTGVCLGSSRFGTCLIEQELTRILQERTGNASDWVLNAAAPAGDLLTSERALRMLLARGIRPRVALIEISPEALNRHNGWMSFHVDRQLCWDEIPAYLPEVSRTGQLGRLCVGRLFPLYAHRKGIWNSFGDIAKSLRKKSPGRQGTDWNRVIGVTPQLSEAEKAQKTRVGLAHVQKCLHDYDPGGLARAALERMLKICREEGITPLLMAPPVSSRQRDLYTPAIEKAFQACLREVCRDYECRFVDCRDRLRDEEFFDNHHASMEGGMRFSRATAEGTLSDVCGRR